VLTTAKRLLTHISQESPVSGSVSFTIGTLARVNGYKISLPWVRNLVQQLKLHTYIGVALKAIIVKLIVRLLVISWRLLYAIYKGENRVETNKKHWEVSTFYGT